MWIYFLKLTTIAVKSYTIALPLAAFHLVLNFFTATGLNSYIELLCWTQVTTARLKARVIWALAEHFDLEGLDPLLADDPEDPLNSIFDHIHKVMFNTDSVATVTNRCTTFLWLRDQQYLV
jgi:hypothetical protein